MTETTRHSASQTDGRGYDERTIETLYNFVLDAFDSVDVFWSDWTSLRGFKSAMDDHGWSSCGSVARSVIDHYTDGEILTENEIDTLYRAAEKWDSLDRAGRDRLTIERLANELARETAHYRRACEALKAASERTERAHYHLSEAKKSRDNWKASAQSYRRQMLALRAGDTEGFKAAQRDRLRAIATRDITRDVQAIIQEG